MSRGDPRNEYLDASNNIRHYGTTRFAEVTIYIALLVRDLEKFLG
jgi:hypothetical protein